MIVNYVLLYLFRYHIFSTLSLFFNYRSYICLLFHYPYIMALIISNIRTYYYIKRMGYCFNAVSTLITCRIAMVFSTVCIRMWSFKLLVCAKHLSHVEHLYGFSPVCKRRWSFRLSFRVKHLSHVEHLYFSCCVETCSLNLLLYNGYNL